MPEKCIDCEKEAIVKCSGCGKVLFCSDEHKKKQSASHKNVCKPYRIENNEKYGRYLVACRPVQQGEMLLRERAVIVGPHLDTLPCCLECQEPLYPPGTPCSVCGVPGLCPRCTHDPLECHLFKGLNTDQKEALMNANNQHVLPLRVLLNIRSEEGDQRFKNILELEAHLEERKDTDAWLSHQKHVVELFQKLGVITANPEDEELVQKICGALDVNSFEVRGPVGPIPGAGPRLRGVYTEAAMMAHDCVSNVHLSVDDHYVMSVRAAVDIPEGHPILYNYTDPLQPTRERQKHLWMGKYFACSCSRCSDPKELGTYMGAVKCPRCRAGYVLLNPQDQEWSCEKCHKVFNHGMMVLATLLCRDKLDSLDRADPDALESLLHKLRNTLSPSHSVVVDIKQSIIAALREQQPTRANTRRKIELCRELLPLLQAIEPGLSRLRGITLYELHIGLVTMSQEFGEHEWLQEAQDVLKEAVSLLLYEPSKSPEGELAKQAIQELKTLKQLAAKHEKKKNKAKHKK
ncbi:SET domain-containing protein SmydA-8-like [Macrosteles quadrilineatus]|uniref:SET domain-containing protein SmydA-8-like n=1 Tax=Macrosteles quadrilineatus TaxID=74068 RepID=UPI0023E0F4B5|nr:SET domain-containing protein SmydA-8-like [Macrosteles quadrilineatus]